MYCIEGICNWVELGNNEKFARIKQLTPAKFSSRSKTAVERIRTMYLVDSYYNSLIEKHDIDPKVYIRLTDLAFPYDYPNHYWSIELLRFALLYDNVSDFKERVVGKSWDFFIEMIEYFRELVQEFDDAN